MEIIESIFQCILIFIFLSLNKIITMNSRNKSLSKLSSIKLPHKNMTACTSTPADELSMVKSREFRTPVRQKQFVKSTNSKSSANLSFSKSKGKIVREETENSIKIQKQFTKSMYKRFQQKLSICTKIQDLMEQIKERESRLKNYFEIYRILQSQVGHQRCLQHNNDLSLYCQTQSKVLCVHCVYGQSKHKTHKVIPLKDCIKHVSKDVSHLQTLIKKDIQDIRIKVKISEKNEKFIQRHFQQQLQDLQKMYVQKLREIETEFTQKKRYVNQYFENLIKRNTELTLTLKDFEKNVHLQLGILNKDDTFPRQDLKQISKQTILTKIAQLSNVRGLALEDMDLKDIGQNSLRSRIKSQTKR